MAEHNAREVIAKTTGDEVTWEVSKRVGAAAGRAISKHGRCAVALASGPGPRALLLAMIRLGAVPWDRLDVFLFDERAVSTDDPRHHEQRARDEVLDHAPMEPDAVHGWGWSPGNDLDACVAAYAARLPKRFDLAILGVDDDGRCGGFWDQQPTSDARATLTEDPEGGPAWFTLTARAIADASDIFVLALGEDVAPHVTSALRGDGADQGVPLTLANRTVWCIDEHAASTLHHPEDAPEGPITLAVDIGGTGVKLLRLDGHGEPIGAPHRIATPRPAHPAPVLDALVHEAGQLGYFDRVSIGFPGVVVDGVTHNAPNLEPSWAEFPLAEHLSVALSAPVRVANDADVQGLGVFSGAGVELTLTLGTGMGSALAVDGTLVPNLEMGHHPFQDGSTYEDLLGQAALDADGYDVWLARLKRAVQQLTALFNPQRVYLGGGNARLIGDEAWPAHVVVVPNVAGLLGGINLWR